MRNGILFDASLRPLFRRQTLQLSLSQALLDALAGDNLVKQVFPVHPHNFLLERPASPLSGEAGIHFSGQQVRLALGSDGGRKLPASPQQIAERCQHRAEEKSPPRPVEVGKLHVIVPCRLRIRLSPVHLVFCIECVHGLIHLYDNTQTWLSVATISE